MLDVEVKGSLQIQGLIELFTGSAEPSFDELPLKDFLGRYPEGDYALLGTTIEA